VPAIQPARLKIQAAQLAELFAQPGLYGRGLHKLLDFYADRTYRPGQAGALPTLVQAYNTPPPVLRQVLRALQPQVQTEPDSALALCRALWAEPLLEFRLLAATLLGQIPLTSAAPAIAMALDWVETRPEDRLLNAVIKQGLANARRVDSGSYVQMIAAWLAQASSKPAGQEIEQKDFYQRHAGLQAMLALIEEPGFDNFPAIFRLLIPFTQEAPGALKPDILAVLTALARRTPNETAYLLRQSLVGPHHPDTPWLIRQILDKLPPHLRQDLRQAARVDPSQA